MLSKQPMFRSLPAMCAIVVMLLGSLVMMGWLVESHSIVQLHESFAPMQFNTALLFLLSGTSLWVLTEGQLKPARIIGFIIFVLALMSTIQYVLNINTGLDELFVSHFTDVNTASPGRMAPNTGICFALIGLLLMLLKPFSLKHWSLHFGITLTTIALGMASVALAGYFNNVTTTYGWGQMTHMALHTCIGFIIISIGLIAFFLQKTQSYEVKVKSTLLLFIFFLSVTLTIYQALLGHERLQLEKRLSFYLRHVESDINSNLLANANRLAQFKEVLQSKSLNNTDLLERYFSNVQHNKGLISFQAGSKDHTWVQPSLSLDFDKLGKFLKNLDESNYIQTQTDKAYVVNLNQFADINEYFLIFFKTSNSEPEILQLFDANSFLRELESRYRDFNIDIQVIDAKGHPVNHFVALNESKDIVSFGRRLPTTGWLIKLYSTKENLSEGSLANVILIFGIVLCGLIAGIAKLLINSRERSIEILSESEERKKALQKANEARLINEMARKVSGLGIWVWDLSKNKVSWDSNMFAAHQLDPKSLDESSLYKSWVECLHPEDAERVESSLLQAVKEKKDWYCSFRLNLNNGAVKYMVASGTCILDERGDAIKMVGGNFDVTELREAQEHLVKLKEQSEQNSLAKSQFLANMSHEIRTPMNGVLGITDLLQQTSLTPIQKEYLDLIVNSATSLLRILNDILDQSKIEAGMMELVEEHFSLDNKIGDLLKGFAPTAHQKMIELEYSIDSHVPSCICADATRIGQIVFNVVGNAVKFTQTGEVVLEVSSQKLDTELEPGQAFTLIITIKDTGIGMAEEKLDLIFEPFGQVDSTTTRRFGGTGLGLPIVKQLVSLMGGSVEVSSQPALGSEFKISIPVKKGDIEELSAEEGHAHIINKFDFTGITCLVVDDNSINRRWLKSMINSWGCKLIVASTGDQALALFDTEIESGGKVDVIFVDRDMPQSDGFQFIQDLKHKYKNIPRTIMMLTSNGISDSIAQIEAEGIEHYLLKPVKQSEVFNMLMNVLEVDRPDLQQSKKDMLRPPEVLLNILVAEDNPINSRLVHDILTYRGHQSTLVFNGRQAVEQFKGSDYDVILMDVQMPEMDGLEATKLIRQFEVGKGRTPIKIIGLTAHALSGDRQICIDAGMDNYLTKPVDSKHLLLTIESYFASKEKSVNPKVIKTIEPTSPEVETKVASVEYKYLSISGINRVSGGRKETIEAITDMTIKILPQELEDVDELIKDGENISLAKLFHRVKGMLANLSGSAFNSDFIELEKLAIDNNLEDLEKHWLTTRVNLEVFLAELKNYISRNNED
ncbi:response regulator [Psychrosphaera sp.]|nr:response regulator [Psychrosphaera sp.]